jgi:hypothetical protein
MNPQIIVSAIIRLWSLQQFAGAIYALSYIPSQWRLLTNIGNKQEVVHESLWANFTSTGINVALTVLFGLILWIYAERIAGFVLATLGVPRASGPG